MFKGEKLELMNSNLISLSLSYVENKMDLRSNKTTTYSTSIDISLVYIDTPAHGNIAFSFKILVHPRVYLFLIRFMPKSWATTWPVPITSFNGSQDHEKSRLEVAVVSSHSIMFQNIESCLISFTSLKLRPPMNKIYHWTIQPISQCLILQFPS